jgi:hypothetical protein
MLFQMYTIFAQKQLQFSIRVGWWDLPCIGHIHVYDVAGPFLQV